MMNNDERRPATNSGNGTARVNVGNDPLVACDGDDEVDGVLLHLANPAVVTEGGDDDHRSGAAWLKQRRRRRRYGQRWGSGLEGERRGRLGDALYRLGLERSDSKREDLSRKNLGLVWRDKLENEFDSDKIQRN